MDNARQVPEPDISDAVHYHYGKFPPANINYERLADPLARTAGSLARYDQALAAMRNSEILLAPLRRQEAVVSSRMEGTISTLDEILQIEADAQSSGEDTLKTARAEAVETLLHARAMQSIQKEMEGGREISDWLVRAAHQILLSYGRGANKNPGTYKTEQNYIGERRRKSVSFVPISPEQLPTGMNRLFEFGRNSPVTPLLKTAISHVEFEALHPFSDGNGRVGRMLITLMLWDYKLIRAPHFYVSAFFEDTRDEYVELMRDVSEKNNWTEWCLFFLDALNTQAERNIETAMRIFSLYDNMKERFRDELNSQWSINAVDFVFANPMFRNNQFTRNAGIPSQTASIISRKLLEAGLLTQIIPSSGRRPAMLSFEALLEIVRNAK